MRLVDVLVGIVLCVFVALWAWLAYLNIRERWHDEELSEGHLPFSFKPRITIRSWIAGICGLGAFLCALYLMRAFPE